MGVTPITSRRWRVCSTTRTDGDVHPMRTSAADLRTRQLAATGRRWTMLDQRHGVEVVDADAAQRSDRLVVGDVIMVDRPDVAVAIWAADCAPVFFLGADGRIIGAHAGWRGLAAGVLDVALDALDDEVEQAIVGPTIHPCCYEFGRAELDLVAGGVGADPTTIAGRTTAGELALDVPQAISSACARREVEVAGIGDCTSCSPRYFSHRRGDRQRHATIAWLEES